MAPSKKGLRKFTSATDRSSIWSVGFCSDIYNLYTIYSYKDKYIFSLKLVGSEDAACLNSLLRLLRSEVSADLRRELTCVHRSASF